MCRNCLLMSFAIFNRFLSTAGSHCCALESERKTRESIFAGGLTWRGWEGWNNIRSCSFELQIFFSAIFPTFSPQSSTTTKYTNFLCELCWIAFISAAIRWNSICVELKLKRFIISHYDAVKQFIVFDDAEICCILELNATQNKKVVEFSISTYRRYRGGFFHTLNRQ